jgi:hypothetical protein
MLMSLSLSPLERQTSAKFNGIDCEEVNPELATIFHKFGMNRVNRDSTLPLHSMRASRHSHSASARSCRHWFTTSL